MLYVSGIYYFIIINIISNADLLEYLYTQLTN